MFQGEGKDKMRSIFFIMHEILRRSKTKHNFLLPLGVTVIFFFCLQLSNLEAWGKILSLSSDSGSQWMYAE